MGIIMNSKRSKKNKLELQKILPETLQKLELLGWWIECEHYSDGSKASLSKAECMYMCRENHFFIIICT